MIAGSVQSSVGTHAHHTHLKNHVQTKSITQKLRFKPNGCEKQLWNRHNNAANNWHCWLTAISCKTWKESTNYLNADISICLHRREEVVLPHLVLKLWAVAASRWKLNSISWSILRLELSHIPPRPLSPCRTLPLSFWHTIWHTSHE